MFTRASESRITNYESRTDESTSLSRIITCLQWCCVLSFQVCITMGMTDSILLWKRPLKRIVILIRNSYS